MTEADHDRPANFDDLRRWMITDLCRYYRLVDTIRDATATTNGYSFRLRTSAFTYQFQAAEPSGDDRGSLSCIAGSWDITRSLSSGPLSKDTWDAILRDIVALEIVPVNEAKPVKRPPAQVPFATPETVEVYRTIPAIAGGEDEKE